MPKYRIRPPEIVAKEIGWNAKLYGLNRCVLADSAINPNLEKFKQFVNEMGFQQIPVKISSQATITNWDEDITELCKKYPIVDSLSFGIESSDENTRMKLMKKLNGMTDEVVKKNLKLVKDAGIFVGTFFMVGYPGEGELNEKFIADVAPYIGNVSIAPYNVGWLSDLSLYGKLDWYIEKVESFEKAELGDFYKYSYVFSDFPGVNVGLKYKLSRMQIFEKISQLSNLFKKHGINAGS
jgi:radical SAM superfamily enzyme YgiQ (UPF0313 family)